MRSVLESANCTIRLKWKINTPFILPNILLSIATISHVQLFRPRLRFMHYSRSSFRAEAGFFVGFLNRFNSSYKSDWIYQDWPYAHSGYWTPISDPWCMYFYRYKFQRRQWSHTSWVTVVTPTDRPKSVRNRCVIELFVTLFVLSLCPFDISVGVGAFVIGLSQISSFFS